LAIEITRTEGRSIILGSKTKGVNGIGINVEEIGSGS
jgi:hypothetical protein